MPQKYNTSSTKRTLEASISRIVSGYENLTYSHTASCEQWNVPVTIKHVIVGVKNYVPARRVADLSSNMKNLLNTERN